MSLEQEAKRMLMERLDDCLKVHADLLDSQDIGSIYELQDLAQLHYYLICWTHRTLAVFMSCRTSPSSITI